ncbi:hypothetical protein, partial [Klebsiella pneumoniae]|uniref:hypothetical protein n=1 Tax=Klebsiella pneumoniae TaxID=573 RepID=UPI003CE8D633
LQPCLLKIYSHMVTFWGNYEGISQRSARVVRRLVIRDANPGTGFCRCPITMAQGKWVVNLPFW